MPTGWQVALKSKHVFGPYEDKIVLEQGITPINGPRQGRWSIHQKAHGGLFIFKKRVPAVAFSTYNPFNKKIISLKSALTRATMGSESLSCVGKNQSTSPHLHKLL